MQKEVKEFFKKLEENNDKDFLLFYRLYKNPFDVLGNEVDFNKAEEEYNNLPCYCQLMMNNNLIEFLNVALYDNNFRICEESHIQIWRKLRFFLWDSREFKDFYLLMHRHDDLFDMVKRLSDGRGITMSEIRAYREKDKEPFNILGYEQSIFKLADLYNKYKRLYDYGITLEQIESYDYKQAREKMADIDWIREVIKEKQDKKAHAIYALGRIEKEDCSITSTEDDVYLFSYSLMPGYKDPFSIVPYIVPEVLDDLVCNNDFLDIIEKKMEEYELAPVAIKNALQIITEGIAIKTLDAQNESLLRGRLGEERVQAFDLKHAKELTNKLITLQKRQESRTPCKIYMFEPKKTEK